MKETGMVMEVDRPWIVLFTSTGEFKKVRYYGATPEIGTELALEELSQRKSPKVNLTKLGVVAAVLLLMVMTPFISGIFNPTTTPAQTVAYVSVDINPSIHMSIDQDNRVLQANAINSDGESILEHIQIQGKTVQTAVGMITEEAIAEGFITKEKANSVIVAIAPIDNRMKVTALEQTLVASAESVLSGKDLASEVQAFQTDKSLKEQAEINGVSMGKLALILKANNDGIQISLDDMKQMSIKDAFNKHGVKAETVIAEARLEPDVTNPEAIAALVESQRKTSMNVMSVTKNNESKGQNQGKDPANPSNSNTSKDHQNQSSGAGDEDIVKPGSQRPNVDTGAVLGPRPTMNEGGKDSTKPSQPAKPTEEPTTPAKPDDNAGDITSDLPNTNDAKPVLDKAYSQGER